MMRSKVLVLLLLTSILVLGLAACGSNPAATTQAPTTEPLQVATQAPLPTEEPLPTATALPTATDLPEPTATDLLEPTATDLPPTQLAPTDLPKSPEKVVFKEYFSKIVSYWPDYHLADMMTAGVKDGAYQVAIHDTEFFYYFPEYRLNDIGDSVITVEVQEKSTGIPAEFGMLCGYLDEEHLTIMGVSPEGYSLIYRYNEDEVIEILYEDAVVKPADQYKLVGTCNAGHYKLEVNGETIIDHQDERLISSGSPGFYLSTLEEPGVVYSFDNFTVEYWTGKGAEQAQAEEPAETLFTGEVVLLDDFSTEKSDWDIATEAWFTTGYKDGGFEIKVIETNFAAFANPNAFAGIGDAIIEVDARLVSGPEDGDFGIICGYEDWDNFHILAIANNGYASLTRHVNTKIENLFAEEAAFTPAEEYHLVASCVGGQAQLYVNGELVIDLPSDELQNIGGYGLHAGSFEEGDLVVHFDNFTVRKP